jgi:predicted dehydrogenase
MSGVTGVLIGAGERGATVYASLLLSRPELGRIVAVAEPNAARRRAFAARFGLDRAAQLDDWKPLLDRPRCADFAVVATPDALHVEPALTALERGYHVLLEKPMALSEASCLRLVEASERARGVLQVCHVLRYAHLFERLHAIARSGELGRLITIQHSENVSFWHYAHSYCRGFFRQRSVAPMILAKSCHDLDLLYWLADAPPLRLTSVARETELCERNAPASAPAFCIDACPHSDVCPYDAVSLYRDALPLIHEALHSTKGRAPLQPGESSDAARTEAAHTGTELRWRGWPVTAVTDDLTPKGLEKALRTTRFGRCVYRVGDNDQPSSQSVNVLFGNGVNASFTMHSTSYREGREIRIDGTRGSAVGGFYPLEQWLEVIDHKTGRRRAEALEAPNSGHGGGDHRLFEGFLAVVRGEAAPRTGARESLWSHRMAFAAELSANEGAVVRFDPERDGSDA